MTYGIWCEVWGGVTGFREAEAKGADGRPKRFATLAEAEAEVKRMYEFLGSIRTANFRYSVLTLKEECQHEWIEQEGEPPVDVCYRCGEMRE